MGVLGLSPVEFWPMTPRQFHHALEERAGSERGRARAADHRVGVLAAVVANAWLTREDGRGWRPDDFFGSLEPPPEREMDPEGLLNLFRGLFKDRWRKA